METWRSRHWCFTINNPNGWDIAELQSLERECSYLIYGIEKGALDTTHFQGYVEFKNAIKFSSMKKKLTRAHIEPRRGTAKQASDYCKKEGDFTETGTLSSTKTNQKQNWRQIIEWAELGDLESIKEEFPQVYLRYLPQLRSMARPDVSILPELQHEWWYGPTGTGKSSKLWRDYPIHYQKELNKWWDGYDNEDIVAIEEWSPKNECTASFLKVWTDHYPFPAQVKFGKLHRIRPKKIIVLSNYTIDQCFPNIEDSAPLKRRFKVIHYPAIFRPPVSPIPRTTSPNFVEFINSYLNEVDLDEINRI